jgi:hypothetical protein
MIQAQNERAASRPVAVTSRVIAWPLLEELGLFAVPVLERGERRSAFQHRLRELAVVEADMA